MERCKEHLRQPPPIHAHIQQTGHSITDTSFNIIGREDQGQARTIKESIFIKVNNPTLNQNIVKYNHRHIWDRAQIGLFPTVQCTNIMQRHTISPTLGSQCTSAQSTRLMLTYSIIISLQQSLVSIRHALN